MNNGRIGLWHISPSCFEKGYHACKKAEALETTRLLKHNKPRFSIKMFEKRGLFI